MPLALAITLLILLLTSLAVLVAWEAKRAQSGPRYRSTAFQKQLEERQDTIRKGAPGARDRRAFDQWASH